MRTTLSIFAFFSVVGLFAQPQIEFETTFVENTKTVEQGQPFVAEYEFTNVGTEPLVITSVVGSCSCVAEEWPRQPIKPGETAVIKGRLDTKRRTGVLQRSLTVKSNAGETPNVTLKLECEVSKAEENLGPVKKD